MRDLTFFIIEIIPICLSVNASLPSSLVTYPYTGKSQHTNFNLCAA